MRRGMLSDLFVGVVAKRLAMIDTISSKSNQHEYQGTLPLRHLLGEKRRQRIPARFIWLSGEQETLSEDGFVTWYDSRENNPERSEFRLYYSTNAVTELMRPDDMLFLALESDSKLTY